MYENIGGKIKGLAKFIFGSGAVASVIAGFVLMTEAIGAGGATGLVVIFGGSLLSWVSSWVLYGFGELIDKVGQIAENTRPDQKEPAPCECPQSPAEEKTGSIVIGDGDQELVMGAERLRSLRDRGLLTDAEYEKAMKLLNKES